MELTAQQLEAKDKIIDFIKDENSQVFILRGYAGSGKTVLIVSIVDYLLENKIIPQLMAPTGRAAKILNSRIFAERIFAERIFASTIHRGIYVFDKLVRDAKDAMKYIFPIADNSDIKICIIDESSMISSVKNESELFQFGTGVLLDDLLTYVRLSFGGKIIFVGDPMQLPPVGDNCSNALNETYFKDKGINVDSFTITDIVRQNKDSAILFNAAMIRDMASGNVHNNLVFKKKEDEVMTLDASAVVEHYCQNIDNSSAIVCAKNQIVADYNTYIRKKIFANTDHVQKGDKLIVVNNTYVNINQERELFNGDIIIVTDVLGTKKQSAPVFTDIAGKKERIKVELVFRDIEFKIEGEDTIYNKKIIDSLLESDKPRLEINEMKALYINFVIRMRDENKDIDEECNNFTDALMHDPYYNALQVKYGYAFTCHKAQGGEWDNVYVDFTSKTSLDINSLRWEYTAITRASKRLWCINMPDITPMSKLTIPAPISKIAKLPNEALSLSTVEETPYHESEANAALKAKYWSVLHNMENTEYSISNISCKPYRDIYEINTKHGIVRVDCTYNKAGQFTRYDIKASEDECNKILPLFENDAKVSYSINYSPSNEALHVLYNNMIIFCEELNIKITNIVEHIENYYVCYYLKTTAKFSYMEFYFNKKEFFSTALAMSELGTDDKELSALIEKLKNLCQ